MRMLNRKNTLSRVDVQVSLLTACMVVLSSVCIFLISYYFTYKDTLLSLTERVESIYNYLEESLDPETFEVINTKADMDKDCYQEMKDLFFEVKKATGVQYLYTAKRAEDGQLVYVIDGLDYEASDFRYPGDVIEEEIVDSLERALNNEKIMPDDIKRTAWGDIFIAYLPIHNSNRDVIGAIGIEFEANHQYITYQHLRRIIPVVILGVCIISGLTALLLFRRLSNPLYQDMANTDLLTGLKNRNAYEMDTKNFTAKGSSIEMGVLLADLDALKLVNDTLGHEAGDEYICAMAKAIQKAKSENEVLYRIGGDEFIVLMPKASEEKMEDYVNQLNEEFDIQKRKLDYPASFSVGFTICCDSSRDVFDRAYREADKMMYEAKKRHYEMQAKEV